jgi:hypothetical protein
MRSLSGRFHQEQAAGRVGWKEPPPTPFENKVLVVFLGFEAKQRQLKPILSATRFCVTNPSVAAGLGQDRDNVVDKTHRPLSFRRAGERRQRADREVDSP